MSPFRKTRSHLKPIKRRKNAHIHSSPNNERYHSADGESSSSSEDEVEEIPITDLVESLKNLRSKGNKKPTTASNTSKLKSPRPNPKYRLTVENFGNDEQLEESDEEDDSLTISTSDEELTSSVTYDDDFPDTSFYLDDDDESSSESDTSTPGTPLTKKDTYFNEKFEEVYQIPKSGVWHKYKMSLEDVLETKNPQSVEELLPVHMLRNHIATERRIQIEGQSFRIIENQGPSGSLYRAVSQGTSRSESEYKSIQKTVLSEIMTNWVPYCSDMMEECGYNELQLPSSGKPKSLLSRYRNQFLISELGAPVFHLQAAGRAYKFHFVLIDAHSYGVRATVSSSNYPEKTSKEMGSTFYFLRTGSLRDTWHYEYLSPIGRPGLLVDGSYPILLFDAIQIDRQCRRMKANRAKKNGKLPQLTHKPVICFSLDNRLFIHKPTHTHDLWSILSELLFHKLAFAPKIYEATLRRKLQETQFYHISKLKKRRLKGLGPWTETKENCSLAPNETLMQRYWNSLKIPYRHNGSTLDLDHAAGALKFSYTLIGMDSVGNFFWRESIASSETGQAPKKFIFFVRLLKNSHTHWFALDQLGSSYSKQLTIYRNTVPDHQEDNLGPKSPWDLILSKITICRKRNANGLKMVPVDRTKSVIRYVSAAFSGFFSRINGWMRMFHRRPKVSPEKSFKELYFRDHP